jgi:diketogulonate reductase-like aldo/keto reductase
MIRLKKSGMVKQIGICNVRMRQLEKMKKWEVVPDIIQIERNPLRVCASETKFCREQGFLLQAYSPLCKMDTRIRDSEILKKIAEKYAKNIGQIVMRWHIDSGYIPIFTSTKPMRVKEYLDIFDFQLSSEEILEINSLNEDYKMYLEACACPGF